MYVGDCRAYFGLKDYQQLLVVQDLARKLGYPEVVPCDTVCQSSGLAYSSRNRLLSSTDETTAAHIYRALTEAKNLWSTGVRDSQQLCAAMKSILAESSMTVEYAEVRDPNDWQRSSPMGQLDRAVALIAVKIGGVRLIDNFRLGQGL